MISCIQSTWTHIKLRNPFGKPMRLKETKAIVMAIAIERVMITIAITIAIAGDSKVIIIFVEGM